MPLSTCPNCISMTSSVYSPENATSVIPLSPGKNFMLLTNKVCSWRCRLRPIGPMSSVSLQVQQAHSRDGKGWEGVSMKTASAWNCKLQGLDQLQGLAYIIVVTSHWRSRSRIAKFETCQIKKYGVLGEIAKFNAHQICQLYGIW